MIPLLRSSDIRAVESAHQNVAPSDSLMARAGAAIATHAAKWLRKHKAKHVLVLAGPGNNGGDAWAAAHELLKRKFAVRVLSLGEQRFSDAAAATAAAAFAGSGKSKGEVIKTFPKDGQIDLVIDGLFGIGLARAPTGLFADVIEATNAARDEGNVHVLAIDVPSGLSADTGVAFAPCIDADTTITMIAAKPGLYTGDAPDHCGTVIVETLGIEAADARSGLLSREQVAALISPRRANSHKGDYGNVGIIGGAEGMTGAAVLAGRAALHMGPGKVFLGLFDKERPAYDALHPEIMIRDARVLAKDPDISAFAVGMGTGEAGAASLLSVLQSGKPLVVDADALNAIASNPSIRAAFQSKKAESSRPFLPFMFTPHPSEAARLLGVTTAEIQTDRVAAACRIAASFSAVCVLKGAGTVIADPTGRYAINPTGNPGMAAGGMGDALAGMLAAFLAQGMGVWDAACLGVYLHGAAADAACHHGMGPHGLTASEVIFEARTLLNSALDDPHDDGEENGESEH